MKRILFLFITNLIFVSSFTQPQTIEISHYLFPQFKRGYILMKSGLKYAASVNYNSLSEEMIFISKGEKKAFSNAEKENIDTIFIKNRKFIPAKDNFMELVYDSTSSLFVEHRCKVKEPGKKTGYGGSSQLAAVTTITSLTNGQIYELKLPDDYKIFPYVIYWLNNNGEARKFANLNQLKKIYDEKEDLLDEYLERNKVDYDDQESIIQLIKYME